MNVAISHARFHFVTGLAKWLTVQCKSGLPILANYRHFNTIRQQVSDISPHFPDLAVLFGDRPSKEWRLCEVGHLSCAPIRSVQHTFAHDLPCRSSELWCRWEFSLRFSHFVLVLICFENNFCFSITIMLLTCAARRVHPSNAWSVNNTWSSKTTCFCIVACMLTYTDKNKCNLRWAYGHSHPGLSPILTNQNFLKIAFP